VGIKIKDWHRRLAKVVGNVSLRIETSHLSRVELENWAEELTDLAAEMRNVSTRHGNTKKPGVRNAS
jgi:hypothetical protein